MDNKKYFLKETGEELKFGDVIELNCVKELEDGRAIVEREIKFSPETVEGLLSLGILETKEPLIDFSDEEEEDCDCPYDEVIQDIIETQEELEKRVDKLEEQVKSFTDNFKSNSEYKAKAFEEFETRLLKDIDKIINTYNKSAKKK